MSIIELPIPWCINTEELTEGEVEELKKHFVKEGVNYKYSWSNTNLDQIYVGVNYRNHSDYNAYVESFDGYGNEENVTVYTIEQLRTIIAEHLAKQPVEPESVTKFVVGKWYKWFQKDHGRTQKGKCATLYDSHVEMKPWICHSSEYVESGMFNLRDAESIELIENLSEIQDLLPDGHEDRAPKPTRSERYLATMKFFEQLREPERSEAIANYDEDYGSGTKVPKDLAEAINYGFEWSSTKQEHEYWMVIKDEIMSGIYFQEEILVFGKYKIGDIVVLQVCTDRYPMFKVSKDSTPDKMIDETGAHSTNPGSFRPATPEEVEAYNQGVRNIADIKPKDYKEAVHCTTQKEWDFVLSKNKFKGTCNSSWIQHKQDTYMDLYNGSFGDVNGTGKDWGYTILTFKQWCEKYGHSYEVVPEYVECIKSHQSPYYTVGKIYTWPNTISDSGRSNKVEVLKGSVWEFKPSTKEAYDKQQEKLKMEELLSEAKRRYPAGTKVRAVVSGPKLTTEIFTLTDSHYWASGSQAPSCETKEGRAICLYFLDMWAEIVKEEPKVTEIKPAKGMHVRCLKENSWNNRKAKVGQVFEIQNVDKVGDLWVENQSLVKGRLSDGEFELLTDYKKEPWIAQVGDWVYTLPDSSGWGMSVNDEGKVFKVKEITNNWCEETTIVLDGSSNPTKASSTIDPVTLPTLVRKTTQEEIDSVTKQNAETLATNFKVGDKVIVQTWHYANVAKHLPCKGVIVNVKPDYTEPFEIELEKVIYGSGKAWWFRKGEFVLDASTEPEWTADNWYVEVNSQEEADAVIDAAAKMYGKPKVTNMSYTRNWHCVSLYSESGDMRLLSRQYLSKHAKPRPITDFIQPEITRVPDEIDCIYSRPLSPKECYKPQQDELVIYKPKQTRLVEPGAVSASASTINLIIKSNSKYL